VKPFAAAAVTSVLLVLALFAIPVAWFYGRSSSTGDGRESFSDKHEWSIMQTILARNEDSQVKDLEFLDEGDYYIVGIPNAAGKTTWVMLNPQSAPYYKQFGSDYSLTPVQLAQITATRHTISTVQECLASHVQSAP
jgi:hypothetical protein